ncbi:uncharacterized protein LOC135480680 [Liolophura sinensis]|uniref:uncharacterized protein LOC135480680 n=1 Tax=Liolophura sinensis TaxID=3198878 RepID=UPI003158EEEF
MSTLGYDYDITANVQNTDVINHDVIFGLGVTLGILTSFLLMSCPVILRRQKSLPFFVMLTSWCLANLLYLVVFAVSYFSMSGKNASALGEFGCRALRYLHKSLAFTRVYLMVLASIMTFLGNQRFHRLFGSSVRVKVLIPVVAGTFVWIMVFLPCIQYWYQPRFVSVGFRLIAYWCLVDNTLARKVLELFTQCVLPYILTAVFVLAWGCRQQKIKITDKKENVQTILLLIMMLSSAITEFIVLGVISIGLTGVVGATTAARYFELCDYTLSPLFCLIAIIFYRRQLLSREDPIPTEESADDVAVAEM